MILTKEQNQLVRVELRVLLLQYDSNMTRLARLLNVSQSQISQVLAGKTGAGMKLLRALSQWSGKPIDEILGKQAPELANENYDLKDEVATLRSDNEALVAALREFVELARHHEQMLRRSLLG